MNIVGMRRVALALVTPGFVALLTSCGQGTVVANLPSPTSAPVELAATPVATTSVAIQDFAFAPAAITVKAGDTVTWTNHDVEQHTVTSRTKAFDSDVINNEKSFSMKFDTAGSYSYFCVIHPNMVGTVVVSAR